jgi:putative glutamine amidotransferase
MYPDPGRVVFGPKTLAYIELDMAGYLAQKGVLPVLLPNVGTKMLEEVMEEMDGFVFQGGTDLAPESYGEKPIVPGKWLGDPYRDEYELKIMDFAINSKKPVLAICRGIQLLNVYFGGTLYQDIATQLPQARIHRDAEAYDKLHHSVELLEGKILDRIYADVSVKERKVNSVHHQAIKTLGDGLEVQARCPEDGVLEAVSLQNEHEGLVLGVQWHPEFSLSKNEASLDPLKLYQFFLDRVKKSSL